MAHYAELDINNKVIRVLTACNQDIATHGGELSEEAANYFGTYTQFSENGVKWVQTSYNTLGGVHSGGKFPIHKNYAGIGYLFDGIGFYAPQPYPSWTKNAETYLWEAPVAYPTDDKIYTWDEETTSWVEVPTE